MNILKNTMKAAFVAAFGLIASVHAQDDAPQAVVQVTVENIAPENGVVLTPAWVGFHNGNFDSYNGGLTALEGLERLAEDGNNELISKQFLDFSSERGGYTYVDISNPDRPRSRLVRTGDLTDRFRQDATLPSETGPIRPGQSATGTFTLRADGSNDFFSYASMVLPTNDFFVANGNPVSHDISEILASGGTISFPIGIPNSGTNDAGTEREDFNFSAGNGLFEGRNLPAGQAGPNQGRRVRKPIANVTGEAFADFRLISRTDRIRLRILTRAVRRLTRFLERFNISGSFDQLIESLNQQLDDFEASITIDIDGLDFNQYAEGIAVITIKAVPVVDDSFTAVVEAVDVENDEAFVAAALEDNLYFNIHTSNFQGGEIRGQIELILDEVIEGTRVLTLSASLDSAQEPGPTSFSAATGDAIVKITVDASGNASYSTVLNVDGIPVSNLIPIGPFSAIHIHNAPRGQNGGVLQDVIVDAGGTPTDFSILE